MVNTNNICIKMSNCVEKRFGHPYMFIKDFDEHTIYSITSFVKRFSNLESFVYLIEPHGGYSGAFLSIEPYHKKHVIDSINCYIVYNQDNKEFEFYDETEFKNKYNDLLILESSVKKFKNYKRKKTIKVKAIRWFKNGDHPNDGPSNKEGKVVRYYRNPDIPGSSICNTCGNPMHQHGWIDSDDGGRIVCPGDYVVTGCLSRETFPMAKELFEENFEEEIE